MAQGKKRRRGPSTSVSTLFCTECGTRMYVPRLASCQREEGHTKHLYCPHCRKKTAHTEVRDFEAEMPPGYYIRRPFELGLKGVHAFHTGFFGTEAGDTVYIYVEKTGDPNVYAVCDIDMTVIKNVRFTRDELDAIEDAIYRERGKIELMARNALTA